MRVAGLLLAAVLATQLLGACSGDAPKPPTTGYQHYVALGDSYTSAPYVPVTAPAGGCLRSNHNYPHLLAAKLRITDFDDVSCAGAQTSSLTGFQTTGQSRVPPQLNALDKDTDLVTVGIGGNDLGISAVLFSCLGAPSSCQLASHTKEVTAALDELRPTLVGVLKQVHQRSPHARVLLVGYPKIAPDARGCAELPGVSAADLAAVKTISRAFGKVLRNAARTGNATYIDVYAASVGHDICSHEPWVNGVHQDTGAAAALHPFAAEQAAVAKLIEQELLATTR